MTPPSTTTKITCPHCQGQIKSPGLPPGSQVTCPKCGKAFRLAGSGREAEASAEPKRRVQGSGFGVQGSGGGRQPEVGAQKPDVGGQRSEVREQRAEVREQRAEVRDQKAERSEQRGRRESVAPQPAAPAPPPVQPAPQSAPAPAKPMRRPHRGTRGPAAEANEPPAPPAADEPANPQPLDPYAQVVQQPDGFVPLDFDGAAQVTQPSHRPPGVPEIIVPRKVLETVDPMMLAPQAPSRPPPSKEIPVVCTLCGTRMHAAPERIGQTMQCPDCHTINEIKPPKKPPKKRGPTLDGSTDYKLEVAAQRPAYRPVVAPRGEYEELAEFDPAQRPPGWSRPEGSAAAAPTQHAPSTATKEPDSLPEDDYDDEDGEEIRVSAPVERLEIKPEIKPLPPPDPDDYMYDGKYDDGLIGDWADRKKGASWKKAPLMIGIIGFLFYPEALLRVVLYSIGLGAMVNLGWVTAAWAQSDDPSYKVFSMLLTVLTAGGLGVLATSFAAVLYTVVLDTANGNDKIEGWPDWSIFDWIANAIYFPAAAFVAGLPGSVFTIAMLSIGLDPVYGAYAVVAPLMLSWVVLFPLVLYSMLAEGTITAPFSAATVKSLKEASDGWVFFYMYSFVMGLVGGAALAFTGSNYVVFRIMGAAGVVAMMLIYCRVLGRLMWYASEKMAKMERRRAAEE